MNDATRITSPTNSRQTVGNSSESIESRGRVQVLEKNANFALDSMWATFARQASLSVETISKPLTNPQISLYNSYYETLIPLSESGEGVVSSGNLVQTLDYFSYGATRVSVSTSTNEKRKYIGQFLDDNTTLEYLNARYMGKRGQETGTGTIKSRNMLDNKL